AAAQPAQPPPITATKLIGLPYALRASGPVRAWGGPARSLDHPTRCALRGLFALGAALRAHWTTLRAARFGACSRLGRPCALTRSRSRPPCSARRDPQLAQRCQRDAPVEHAIAVARDLVEQRPVDGRHRNARSLRVPVAR